MPVISTTKMTARQFGMLGEDPPGVRLELVDGEIAVSPSPFAPHSYADRVLSHILLGHIEQCDLGILLGDVATVFGEFDVRRPDLLFFSKSRAYLIPRAKAIHSSPDLCVEIVSPRSVKIDREDKFIQYAAGEVAYYWIVDPRERYAEAYELDGREYRMVGSGSGNDIVRFPPFADLGIPLGKLWLPEI